MLQLSLPSPTHSGRLGLPQRAARLVLPPHSAAQDLPLRQRGARWSRLVTRESPQGAASRLAPFQEPEYLEEEVAKQAVDRVLELIKDTGEIYCARRPPHARWRGFSWGVAALIYTAPARQRCSLPSTDRSPTGKCRERREGICGAAGGD